jgi:TM2 domain-containing membrane protein YozV
VLSFLWCGRGQIYNGQVGKGILVGVLYLACWLLFWLVLPLFGAAALWIYGMVDAYRTAENFNRSSR